MQTVTQPREKIQKKRKQNITTVAAKKRKVDVQNQPRLPIVTTADDLVGKRICQKFEEDGRDAWFYGTVLSKEQGQNPYFNVRYDDEDTDYRYQLMEDWNNDDIKLVALTEDDLIGNTSNICTQMQVAKIVGIRPLLQMLMLRVMILTTQIFLFLMMMKVNIIFVHCWMTMRMAG